MFRPLQMNVTQKVCLCLSFIFSLKALESGSVKEIIITGKLSKV